MATTFFIIFLRFGAVEVPNGSQKDTHKAGKMFYNKHKNGWIDKAWETDKHDSQLVI